jgi:ribosome-associated translation inhibitor RaiA
MQLKIVQPDVKISESQLIRLNQTLQMQLGRYTQLIESVKAIFEKDVDQFGQKIFRCSIEIGLLSKGLVSTSTTATAIEDAFYNSTSRAKRQIDRQLRGSRDRSRTNPGL